MPKLFNQEAAGDNTMEVTEILKDADGNEIKETKSEKFIRLASARTTKAVNQIESIGKLSTGAYEYDAEKVDAMFNAIIAETKDAYAKFQPKVAGTSTKKSFRF